MKITNLLPSIILTIFCTCLFTSLLHGQDYEQYSNAVKEAEALYNAKSYRESAARYKVGFDFLDGKARPNDRYNAACSYALAENADVSFYHLLRLANDSKYNNYKHLTTDTDLDLLHTDNRWEELITIVKENKEKLEANYDWELIAILDKIYQEDQTYRKQIGEIEKEFGRDSEEMKAHWNLISTKDSTNLIPIKKILDERGWLGTDIIGGKGNSTLFLVIQHADIETQKKYLPMMREAVKLKNANPGSLALLEDRVALRQGKKQIYGSQIGRDPETGEHYVLPLEDPANVDQRRSEVGLPPIQNYISNWDITWDVEAYIKFLAELEAKD